MQRFIRLYTIIALALFLSVADLHLGRSGLLPIPPTVSAIVLLAPLAAWALFKSALASRRAGYTGNLPVSIIFSNWPAVGAFSTVALVSLLMSVNPTAYWEEDAKWIFLISYGFIVFLLAMIVMALPAVRESVTTGTTWALILLTGSMFYELGHPGAFSTLLTRTAGFPGNSNFGALVAVMLCASLIDFDQVRAKNGLILALTGLGILTTMSRSGLINFTLQVVLFCYWQIFRGGIKPRRLLRLVAGTFVAVALLAIVVPVILDNTELFKGNTRISRFLTEGRLDDGSAGTREAAAFDSVRLISEAPILGHGTGFSRTMTELPHNLYLQQWVNNGILGVLSYLLLIATSFYIFARRDFLKGKALILSTAIGSAFSHNVLDQKPFLMLLGILLAESYLKQRENGKALRT